LQDNRSLQDSSRRLAQILGFLSVLLGLFLPMLLAKYAAYSTPVHAGRSVWVGLSGVLNEFCFAWYGAQLIKGRDPWGRPIQGRPDSKAAIVVEGITMLIVSTVYLTINLQVVMAKYPPRTNPGGGFLFVPVITALAMMLSYIVTDLLLKSVVSIGRK
jgi:hypothetical protein